MFAADNWCVKVDERVYGPYSSQQLRKFAHEGRLAEWSLVAPAGSRAWRAAREESTFASFFGHKASKKTEKSFGKRNDVETADAKAKSEEIIREANFVVIFDVVSGAAGRVEAAILSLGAAFRLADNVWNVTCELTAVGVRNAIAPYLQPRESLFVVDATRGHSSWQNYAPETKAKITASYINKPTTNFN